MQRQLWSLERRSELEDGSFSKVVRIVPDAKRSSGACPGRTLYHIIDEASPLYGLGADDLAASEVSLIVVVSGYDVVDGGNRLRKKFYVHSDIRFGHRYVDILGTSEDGRLRIRLQQVP